MGHFFQFHFLTVYPPSNPNRDEIGRPKSAVYGNAPRLRISSQSIKRAVRCSEIFRHSLEDHLGIRSRMLGDLIKDHLIKNKAVPEKEATDIAAKIAEIFGKLDDKTNKSKGTVRIKQLAFISPDEKQAALDMADSLHSGELKNNAKDLEKELKGKILRSADGAVDLAMFGRMLADTPDFNREAAVQVSHAITTHKAVAEDDFFIAADDLKDKSEDMGAGFAGDAAFGSGVYYLYACIDTDLLKENLKGDEKLACKAVQALAEALATSSPSGKKNSFAHQTFAGYIRAEYGNQQPRSLAGAFFVPVRGEDLMGSSIAALEKTADHIRKAYGDNFEDEPVCLNVAEGQGSMKEILAFIEERMSHG